MIKYSGLLWTLGLLCAVAGEVCKLCCGEVCERAHRHFPCPRTWHAHFFPSYSMQTSPCKRARMRFLHWSMHTSDNCSINTSHYCSMHTSPTQGHAKVRSPKHARFTCTEECTLLLYHLSGIGIFYPGVCTLPYFVLPIPVHDKCPAVVQVRTSVHASLQGKGEHTYCGAGTC